MGFVQTGIWEVTSNLVPPKARRKGYSGSKSELEQLIAVTFGSPESMREWISSFCDSRCPASSLRPIVAFRVGSEQMTLRFNLRLGHEVAVEVNDVMSDFGIVHITGPSSRYSPSGGAMWLRKFGIAPMQPQTVPGVRSVIATKGLKRTAATVGPQSPAEPRLTARSLLP